MRPALVTGGAGFVGANLVRRLVDDGERVTVTVGPGTDAWRLAGVTGDVDIHELDARDSEGMRALIRQVSPTRVFHLAAHGAYSWQTDARRILETNVLGTSVLLDACAAAEVEAVVHAGSSSEYGLKDHPAVENERLDPNSVYAVAKGAATQLCTLAAQTSELCTVTLRLYSIYGPFEEPQRLIPRLIACGLEGSLPPLADPATARDFVFVDDAVEAFLRASEPGGVEHGGVYNVGSGRQTSLEDVVALMCDILSVEEQPVWGSGEIRSWDTDVWVADARKIRAELGWEPRHELESGLRRTVEWISRPEWRARYSSEALP
jgi:nucleoside-diphosphate-sugar epimerase